MGVPEAWVRGCVGAGRLVHQPQCEFNRNGFHAESAEARREDRDRPWREAGWMPTQSSLVWGRGWRGAVLRSEQLDPESVLRVLSVPPRPPRRSVAVRHA